MTTTACDYTSSKPRCNCSKLGPDLDKQAFATSKKIKAAKHPASSQSFSTDTPAMNTRTKQPKTKLKKANVVEAKYTSS